MPLSRRVEILWLAEIAFQHVPGLSPMVEQRQETHRGSETPPAGDPVPPLSSACIPIIVGAIAAIGLIGLFFPAPRPHSLSWRGLFSLAGVLLLCGSFVSGAVARWIARRTPNSPSGIAQAAWMGALWVPAWALCLQGPSLLTVLAACFCAMSITRSLKRYHRDPETADERPSGGLFWIDDSKPLARLILPSLALAVIAEGATIAIFGERYRLASLLTGGCVAALVWRFRSKAAPRDELTKGAARPRKIISFSLAFLFTMVVLLPYLKGRRLFPTGDMLLAKSASGGRRAEKGQDPANGSDGYTGIILLPLTETHTAIVAPRRKDSSTTRGRPAQPMVIPFDGVYWYFKAPDKRPRPSARMVRGSSTKAVIRSSDRYPLLMEAHQRLGTRIDLGCCSGVQIVLQNADHRPGPIALELWFTDSLQPRLRGSYLGTVTIPSSEVEGLRELPAEETMAFAVPASVVGREFDEITVVVRPAQERSRTGAQIAIRRFVLMP